MHTSRIAAVMFGGILMAAAPAAMAQSVAYATPEPRSEVLVFLDKGNQVPDSAVGTLSVAVVAAQAGRQVKVIGQTDQAAAVKRELVREGAPASRIVIAGERPTSLPQVADNITDPANRRVELKF